MADAAGWRKRRTGPGERRERQRGAKTLSTKQAGVAWVDRKSDFDQLFALYRHILTGLLGVALAVIACGAMLRLGWRKGLVSGAVGIVAGMRAGDAGI